MNEQISDEAIEAMLAEAGIPEFVFEHSLQSLGHEDFAHSLDRSDFHGGYIIVHMGTMREQDILWYTTAKHLALMDEAIEFLSLRDVGNIASGGTKDTDCDHVFIEGFCYADRHTPLTPTAEHDIREQLRYWVMHDVCLYPYIRGTSGTIQEWYGEDFMAYLCRELGGYQVNS